MTATRELSTLVTDETRLVRAWVNFNGTGTVAIRASYNVSSITDNSPGFFTINFTNAMPDSNYVAVGIVSSPDHTGGVWDHGLSRSTTGYQFLALYQSNLSGAGAGFDPSICQVAIFR